jgi:hypothetical protein
MSWLWPLLLILFGAGRTPERLRDRRPARVRRKAAGLAALEWFVSRLEAYVAADGACTLSPAWSRWMGRWMVYIERLAFAHAPRVAARTLVPAEGAETLTAIMARCKAAEIVFAAPSGRAIKVRRSKIRRWWARAPRSRHARLFVKRAPRPLSRPASAREFSG